VPLQIAISRSLGTSASSLHEKQSRADRLDEGRRDRSLARLLTRSAPRARAGIGFYPPRPTPPSAGAHLSQVFREAALRLVEAIRGHLRYSEAHVRRSRLIQYLVEVRAPNIAGLVLAFAIGSPGLAPRTRPEAGIPRAFRWPPS
jgi:hypothetical protein